MPTTTMPKTMQAMDSTWRWYTSSLSVDSKGTVREAQKTKRGFLHLMVALMMDRYEGLGALGQLIPPQNGCFSEPLLSIWLTLENGPNAL